MDIHEHTTPERLERYAFCWSLARMTVAALSLFFGAMPIAYKLGLSGLVGSLLPLFWLISGAAALYLGYRWYTGGQTLFGGTDTKDRVAFLIMVITGLNLGYAAIGSNIGMGFAFDLGLGMLLMKITAIIYVIVAYYLWKRWTASGERLFADASSGPAAARAEATRVDS